MTEPGRFISGGAPGPGRPKGSVGGRTRAIQMIDELIAKHADKLHDALEKEFLKNPVRFWTRYGVPLVPTALVAKIETTPGGTAWSSYLEIARLREVERLATAAGLPIPPQLQPTKETEQ